MLYYMHGAAQGFWVGNITFPHGWECFFYTYIPDLRTLQMSCASSPLRLLVVSWQCDDVAFYF